MLKRLPKLNDSSLSQWINAHAHWEFPFVWAPFKEYYHSYDICKKFDVSYDDLLLFVVTAPTVYAFLCENDALLIHPDGFNELITSWGKRFSPFKPLRHPITKKAISP